MPERKNEASWVESRRRWQINVQVDGKRKTFTSSIPGRKGKLTAERKADAWIREPSSTESVRCEKLLNEYVTYLETTKDEGHARQYRCFVQLYILPVIGLKRINKLTPGDLQDVIDLAYARRKLSHKTLRNLRACLLNWLKWCRLHGKTTLHPEGLSIPAGAKKSEKRVMAPSGLSILFSSDKTTWWNRPVTDWYIHAYRFAVLTGLRPGEVIGLELSDAKSDKITVHRSVNVMGKVTQGKNNNARRTIFLPTQAQTELKAQKAQLRQAGLISPYLFPDKNGDRVTERTLYGAWQRYCIANGIPPISLYELRHTFVSVNKKMPDGLKKKVVGHSQDMDTEGTYGHLMDGDLEEAARFSEAAFSSILRKQA